METPNTLPGEASCISAEELARDERWWRIYRASFPAEEREAPEIIESGIERDVAMVSRISLEGRTVGVASTHLLTRTATAFLVYLAVDPEHRGQNLGTTLWKFAWNSASERLRNRGLAPRGMIWEVENPKTADSSLQAATRERRIRFFERMGGVLLPYRYVQPPVGGVAVPMSLMFRGTMPNAAEIRRMVEAMYFEKYGAVNGIPSCVLQTLLGKE